MSKMDPWRGLRALIETAVDEGTSAVERVHRATAARPFAVLDAIPPIAAPARGVRVVHDAILDTVYGSIRGINHLVGGTLASAIDAIDRDEQPPPPQEPAQIAGPEEPSAP
jgi:hypothetical protein